MKSGSIFDGQLPPAVARLLARLTDEENRAWYRSPGAVIDPAVTVWLTFTCAVFLGHDGTAPLWLATLVGTGVFALGRILPRELPPALALPLLFSVVFALAWPAGLASGIRLGWGPAAWIAAAICLASGLARIGLQRVPSLQRAGEAWRWVVLLAAAVWLVRPFYTHRPLGAGDAHWYALMLADFAAQIRAGQFPVWVGQTEYAFNGTVSPLRLAPWFQHFGAMLDLATFRQLDYLALRNGVLAANMIALSGSAYWLLRGLLPDRPLPACALALALVSSPAVLSPLFLGDQYMTFLALPFLCLAAGGLVQAVETGGPRGHVLLAAGVAGLWITHTPLALWTSLLFALGYLAAVAPRLDRHALGRILLCLGLCTVLGGYPVVSALNLENVYALDAQNLGTLAAREVVRLFPGVLLPLSPLLNQPSDYQTGYTLLAVLLAGLASLRRGRPAPPVLALLLPLGLALLLLLPVAAWARLVWQGMPDLIMQISNTWPQQRLLPIAAVLTVFLLTRCSGRVAGWGARRPGLLVLIALGLLGWSAYQADRLARKSLLTIPAGPRPGLNFQANNLVHSRYNFASFASTPAYFSHGFMDPLLEHRLLRRDGTVLISNRDAAAGATAGPQPPAASRLAHGLLRAINDNQSVYYNLSPALPLPAKTPLLLRLDFLPREQSGWFQVVGEDVRREYMLPDSGDGTTRHQPSRAFGSLPSSARTIPLYTGKETGETPRLTVILPQAPIRRSFDYARYELWRYDPAALPVAVNSWVPYRLRVDAPEAGYLETPRLWLDGYLATINGQPVPVERSADNLAMFAVPAGRSEITIGYAPPALVRAAYWTSLLSWVTLLGIGLFRLRRPTSAITPAVSGSPARAAE